MSVRLSLLALLDQGPCYGYQLRAEFERRTGATWPLNVGQIYNTLERLERDGLVERSDADGNGHVFWAITPAGSVEASGWIGSPVPRGLGTRDELAIKLALAATLPGVDVDCLIKEQRRTTRARLESLRREELETADASGAEEIARSLIVDAMILAAEAEERLLERAEQRLAAHPGRTLALSDERPKRGRPAKQEAPAHS